MPYIKQESREKFKPLLDLLPDMEDPGELNYLITEICHEALRRRGIRYINLNAVVGVLECAKLELYRRVTAPYEDKKIIENGDVGLGVKT